VKLVVGNIKELTKFFSKKDCFALSNMIDLIEEQVLDTPDSFNEKEIPWRAIDSSIEPAEISLSFISKAAIRKLNKKYRNIDEITDVLSYNYTDYSDSTIGDVLICLEYLKNEDRLNIEEVLRMIVHGVLHILGLNHEKKLALDLDLPDENGLLEPMFEMQERIVRNLIRLRGIPRP